MPIFTIPTHTPLLEQNDCHNPAGHPAGGGRFGTKETCGGAGAGADRASKGEDGAAAVSPTLKALSSGTITDEEPLNDGANTSVRVTIEGENGEVINAIYKPEIGETWKSSFVNRDINDLDMHGRGFSLAEREAFAYEVDQRLGTNLVPETVVREGVDVDVGVPDDPYDEDDLRDQYEQWREQNQDAVYDEVGAQMHELYSEAQQERVTDLNNRAEEIADIWNELIDQHPEFDNNSPYGDPEVLADHPVLPLSDGPFNRRTIGGEVDPLEVIDEANIDPERPLTVKARARVEAILYRQLQAGARELLDVDEDAAREHLTYDSFIEDHADTEMRLMDEAMDSFSTWKEKNGYDYAPHQTRNAEGAERRGSLQRFVEGATPYGYMDYDNAYPLAVLDYAIGSMDRHAGNLLFNHGDVVAIDNGYSMPSRPSKFRTAAFSYITSTQLTPRDHDDREALLGRIRATDWDSLIRKYDMDDDQIRLFKGRLSDLEKALSTPEGLAVLLRKTPTLP